MIFPIFLMFITVLLTGISQVLLKIGSDHKEKRNNSVFAVYLNIHTIVAYGLLLLVTVISVVALNKGIPLKMFYAFASLNLVVVVVLSWKVLKERITWIMIVGIVVICLGIVVFNY